MSVVNETSNYRKQTLEKLLIEYKDIIDKIFTVAEVDLLQEKIENTSKKNSDNEQHLLTAIDKRASALGKIDEFLDKIEKIEKQLKEIDSSDKETEPQGSTKNKYVRE